jgi:hypothetical protein
MSADTICMALKKQNILTLKALDTEVFDLAGYSVFV